MHNPILGTSAGELSIKYGRRQEKMFTVAVHMGRGVAGNPGVYHLANVFEYECFLEHPVLNVCVYFAHM